VPSVIEGKSNENRRGKIVSIGIFLENHCIAVHQTRFPVGGNSLKGVIIPIGLSDESGYLKSEIFLRFSGRGLLSAGGVFV